MNRASPLLTLIFTAAGVLACAQEPGNPSGSPSVALARYTPTVRLIEESLPSAASIQTFQETGQGSFQMGVGSASVIHEDGYLLTNEHVLVRMQQGQVLLPGRPPLGFRVVARMNSEDLALIKVDAGEPLKAIQLGRSDDLMLGEPVLTIGNPGGLTHSVSTGIVSGLNRSTAVGGTFLPMMIQTSAAVSGGNSGGPLINALGYQIGVVTSKKLDGENISFAIAVDRVREMFPVLLSAELRYSFRLGLEVDMYAPLARVTLVRKGSPAERAELREGDVVLSVDGKKIRQGFDFQLAFVDRKPGEGIKVVVRRGEEEVSADLVLGELELSEPVADKGMKNGLNFEGYNGRWDVLPDFAQLEAVTTGQADLPTESAYQSENGENYGLRFRGFLKVPREGLYTFYTSSDDGSRLSIAGQVVVDNDGLHAVLRKGGLIRLKEGLHPVEVSFFEQGGGEELEVSWEGPDIPQAVIPAEAWFHKE